MASELCGPALWFEYRTVGIRELDGDRLLESEEVGDNVLAILAKLRDHKRRSERLWRGFAGLAAAERENALGQLLILAGLRHFEGTVEQEARKMPIFIDILENQVLGREFKTSALARIDPPDMQSAAYGVVCGVQEYAESRTLGLGLRQQALYLDEGTG
jgi:hypothetical protein